ncbi:MAG TPA: SPFH domain-containing protein [Bacteroidia bacterium]|jgi:regulator of protease activity HflC (stomatin/prohibitin superfamily)|nr:SPFH domain-containing protein [Bacteroidia bacterium]
MKKFILILGALALLASCKVVPAGYKGVRVYLLGRKHGPDTKVLDMGRYRVGPNKKIYLFPTFQQNFTWGHDNGYPSATPHDPFLFQSKEGINVSVDLGISFHIVPDSVKAVFMKWRKDINYIANVYFDNSIHDALIHVASNMAIEDIYGPKKQTLVNKVDSILEREVNPYGIIVDRIFITDDFKLPAVIVNAINSKMEATQIAQQRENELREVEAEANKKVATAKGESESKLVREKMQNEINILQANAQAKIIVTQAKSQAESIVIQAKSQSDANKMIQTSLNDKLVELKRVEKWDGHLPTYTGSLNPNITLPR